MVVEALGQVALLLQQVVLEVEHILVLLQDQVHLVEAEQQDKDIEEQTQQEVIVNLAEVEQVHKHQIKQIVLNILALLV